MVTALRDRYSENRKRGGMSGQTKRVIWKSRSRHII